MTLSEKQKILEDIFNITDKASQREKDKFEGIIIGLSLRETNKTKDLKGLKDESYKLKN